MQRLLLLLPLFIALFLIHPLPGFCAGKVMSLIVSATLPPHVMAKSLSMMALSSANQLVQTQNVIRNNRSIRLVSIVVP
jgi:hypothetical protein